MKLLCAQEEKLEHKKLLDQMNSCISVFQKHAEQNPLYKVDLQMLTSLKNRIQLTNKATFENIDEALSILNKFDKLLASSNKEELETMSSIQDTCPVTEQKLFEVLESGSHNYLITHGLCDICNKYYAKSELCLAEGIDFPSWPLRFINTTCKICFDKQ